MDRIDVHHHFVPQPYAEALNAAGGDPAGWNLPQWNAELSMELMQNHGTRTAIHSITAPGSSILQGEAASTLCREVNVIAAELCEKHPGTFGFFATLPSLPQNLDAVLNEVVYSLDVLEADGVVLLSSYENGSRYLGHPEFRPLWNELNRRAAVVFVHPTHTGETKPVNPALPQPVLDFPHETTRAAVDLIMSNTVKDHPNVKIILSHAGGSFPYLAARAAYVTHDAKLSTKDPEEFLEEARSFYFDLALSANPWTLGLLLNFAKPGHVMYGSDFPYAPTKTINRFVEITDAYQMNPETARAVARGTAERLFPRFKMAS